MDEFLALIHKNYFRASASSNNASSFEGWNIANNLAFERRFRKN